MQDEKKFIAPPESRKSLTKVLLGVTICYMFILTLKPFEFSTVYLHQYLKFESGIKHGLLGNFKPNDIYTNIIFFIPFGFLGGIYFKLSGNRKASLLIRMVIFGMCLSMLMEFGQLFLRRTTNLVDVISNSFGTLIGALFISSIDLNDRFYYLFIKPKPGKCLTSALIVYIILLMLFLFSPIYFTSFVNWDRDFHLLIGNEATMDRPWEGTLYEFAFYSEVLIPEKIGVHFISGKAESQNKALIAHYKFNEGTGRIVHDVSSHQPSLDLIINDTSKVRWNENENGLHLFKGSLVSSTKPGIKLVEAVKPTQQLSIEMWIQPANLSQSGPARIVSLSKNPFQRNFMLGQAEGSLNFRVRTPITGQNGSLVELFTDNPYLSEQRQHIVATFDHGVAQIYLNGKRLPDRISGYSDYIAYLGKFGTKFVGKAAFCFMILFPLGWLIHFRRQNILWKFIVTPMTVLAPVIMAQLFLYLLFRQPFDFPFIIASSIAGLFFVILSFYEWIWGSDKTGVQSLLC